MADDLRAEARGQILAWLTGGKVPDQWDEQGADEVLALPAVREALATTEERDQLREKVRRVDEAFHAGMPCSPDGWREFVRKIRRALAGEDHRG